MSTGAPAGHSDIEERFRAKRDAGRKLLVPFVTGGLGADWLDVVRAVAAAGADAVEVGTATFADPRAALPVGEEVAAWCRGHDVGRVVDLVGTVRPPETHARSETARADTERHLHGGA